MNSEVTLEQLATLQYMLADEERELSRIAGTTVNMGPGNSFIPSPMIAVREARIALLKQLLTTPPASGEVVGVPREPTMGRGSMMDAGVAAARSHKEAKDIDPTFGMVRAIYAAMLSAAPKQAMGWRDIESAPEVKGKYFWCFLAWGAEDDQSIGEGFRYDGKWYAAATFYQAGKRHDERQYFWREQEVNPTHWQELPSPPEKAGG